MTIVWFLSVNPSVQLTWTRLGSSSGAFSLIGTPAEDVDSVFSAHLILQKSPRSGRFVSRVSSGRGRRILSSNSVSSPLDGLSSLSTATSSSTTGLSSVVARPSSALALKKTRVHISSRLVSLTRSMSSIATSVRPRRTIPTRLSWILTPVFNSEVLRS